MNYGDAAALALVIYADERNMSLVDGVTFAEEIGAQLVAAAESRSEYLSPSAELSEREAE